ncbi:meiotic 218 [Carabus blaptoides fortunei]
MDESEKKRNLFKMFLLKKYILIYLNNKMEDIVQRAGAVFQTELGKNDRQHNFFFYEMHFDILQSTDTSGYMSQSVIREPLVFKNAVREVIHLCVTTLLHNTKINVSQIIVSVIPSTLPGAGDCVVHTEGLCSFRGVLVEHTVAKKYTEMSENIQHRSTGDLILARFINEHGLQMCETKTYAAVLVKLTEINSDVLELGSVYNVTGIQTQHGFEAWNCVRHVPRPITINTANPILTLCASLAYSPWMFTYALAAQLGRHLYCPMSFMHLKMGLLLSLASHNRRSNFACIPVLAMGEDTLEAAQLMQCASQYAVRCVYPTFGQPVLVHHRKDGWLEAGPLLLAQGGVCALGDWDKYRRADKLGFNIRAAIESGNINVDGSNMPLQSAVWTYWRTPRTFKEKQQLQALINVFGMPFLTESHDNYESDVDFHVAKHTSPAIADASTTITHAHLREFLQALNEYDVALNAETQSLIKHYFVASRTYRPACLPVRAVGFLTGLTEAHARLNQRQYALIEDVVAAIAFYEESIQRVFGVCDLSTPPPLNHVADLTQVDAGMRLFERWLQNYVTTAQTIA